MKKFKQVMVLLFVALITLFQTFASEGRLLLFRIYMPVNFTFSDRLLKLGTFCSTERWLSVLHWHQLVVTITG